MISVPLLQMTAGDFSVARSEDNLDLHDFAPRNWSTATCLDTLRALLGTLGSPLVGSMRRSTRAPFGLVNAASSIAFYWTALGSDRWICAQKDTASSRATQWGPGPRIRQGLRRAPNGVACVSLHQRKRPL